MKYLISIYLLVIIFPFINLEAKGNTYKYKWYNTVVEIKRYDNLSNYTDIPYAHLYINDIRAINTNIRYNKEGDWLYYLKDVDTTKVGEYKVWYKAYEQNNKPGTCENYKTLVTFRVVDKTKPKIVLNSDYFIINNIVENIDYVKNNYINIECNNEYTYFINDSNVRYQNVGIYNASITVTDIYDNSTTKEFKVKIIDVIKPVITIKEAYKELITIERSRSFVNNEVQINKYFSKYFIITSNDDYNIKVNNFNYEEREEQIVEIKVIDINGNYEVINVKVLVIDNLPPVLTLYNENITMQYETKFSRDLFIKYINEASDDGINLIDEVIIDINSLKNEIGHFIVSYTLKDLDDNITKVEQVVTLVTYKEPIIEVKDIIINKGEEVIFGEYINVYDNSDPNIIENLIIDDSNFDNNVPGNYYLNVSVTNSSGLTNSNVLKITVLDDSLTSNSIYKLIAIIVLIIIILISIFIYLYKKKHNNKEIYPI